MKNVRAICGWAGVAVLVGAGMLAVGASPAADTSNDDANVLRDANGTWTNDKSKSTVTVDINKDTNSVVLTGSERWKGTFDGTAHISAEREATVADVRSDDPSVAITAEDKQTAIQNSAETKIKLELDIAVKPGSYGTLVMTGKMYPLKATLQGKKIKSLEKSDEPVEVKYTRVVRTF